MSEPLALKAATNATWTYGPIALLEDNAPVALPAGTLIRMQLRKQAGELNVALTLSRDNGLLKVEDLAAALISIDVPVSKMETVPAGSYAFDILVIYPSDGFNPGRVRRPVSGTVEVEQGITDPGRAAA